MSRNGSLVCRAAFLQHYVRKPISKHSWLGGISLLALSLAVPASLVVIPDRPFAADPQPLPTLTPVTPSSTPVFVPGVATCVQQADGIKTGTQAAGLAAELAAQALPPIASQVAEGIALGTQIFAYSFTVDEQI